MANCENRVIFYFGYCKHLMYNNNYGHFNHLLSGTNHVACLLGTRTIIGDFLRSVRGHLAGFRSCSSSSENFFLKLRIFERPDNVPE